MLCARNKISSLILVVLGIQPHALGLDCKALQYTKVVKLESEKLTIRKIQSVLNPKIPAKDIKQAFPSLYFLAKQRIPHTTNFESMLDLLGLLGVNVN